MKSKQRLSSETEDNMEDFSLSNSNEVAKSKMLSRFSSSKKPSGTLENTYKSKISAGLKL